MTCEAGIGGEAGNDDLGVVLLGLVNGRAWWERRPAKCSRC